MVTGTIIAEIGSVHDGSFGNACKLIDLAASCGVDIVKFQTHIAEAETLADAPDPPYFRGEPRMAYFERTAFREEQWRTLKARCEDQRVKFMSSPFSIEAVKFLESLGVDCFKIPSGENTNLPMLVAVAKTGKPVFLSSGMSDWKELDAAVEVLRKGGPLTVLQCTSAYPCPPERVGLNVIPEMKARYGVAVGFSDHTTGHSGPFAAAAVGAVVVEKHLTFSKLMYGSDAANAMEPDEFRQMCTGLREIWAMQSHPVNKDDLTALRDMKRIFEKSIVIARDLPEGHALTADDLTYKKPGDGISAALFRTVIGRRVRHAVRADHKLSVGDLRD